MEKEIFACGACGVACTENGEALSIPENWNPNKHKLIWCRDCENEENADQEHQERRVTREMALDAGEPTLEGTIY